MARKVFWCAWLPMGLLISTALVAQPSFQPSGGMLGPNTPAVIDDDGDGPGSGDNPAFPTFGKGGTILFLTPCGTAPMGASSTGDAGPGVYDVYQYNGTFQVNEFDGGFPIAGDFDGDGSDGGLELVDSDSDGIYDQIRLLSTNPFYDDLVFDLLLVDTDDDDVPDYVGPGGLSSVIGGCPGYDPADPIWVPLAQTGPTTKSVVLDLDGNGIPDPEFLPGPPLVGLTPDSIPTLGTWGLLGLILALVAFSLRTLRLGA